MRRIERLPEDLVNKFAAGEVVERPASVVKELLENALDASARSVLVEIEGGGKGLVRVRDDGHGMSRDDAALAVERHATSKLHSFSDLQSLETHGFRGEALPSIASVSHLRLVTREDGSEAGTEVEVRHGRAAPARDAGHPIGTTVEVRDLFGAVPARRKFLRADSTEASHVSEAVTLLALSGPKTRFTLLSSGRRILEAPPAEDLAGRIYQVFGGAFLDELVPVHDQEGPIEVVGFIGRPQGREVGSGLRLFVNGRAVRDRALAKAVSEGYRAAGAARSEAILFVHLPAHLVDVNVHPAKTEVRFADPREVFSAVQGSVERALARGARVAPEVRPTRIDGPSLPEKPVPAGMAAALLKPVESLLPELAPHPLGQHRLTYIVASDGEDLVLVDQHTAHERIRFEALVARLETRSAESQRLLVPAVVSLAPRLRPLLEVYEGELEASGFEVEPFGGDSLRIGAVPALLGTRDPGPSLEALLSDLLERETTTWAVSSSRDRLAATLACHSAVRAGEPLTLGAMTGILRDLAATTHPTICPHGRPTSVRIAREEVARWFERTGWSRS
jgi:DNA mismatch repair protein MutL